MAAEQQEGDYAVMPPPAEAPGLLDCCFSCFCCLLCTAVCTPLLACCCCCSGINTAAQKAQGKRWDGKQRRWIIDDLDEEATTLEGIPADDGDILTHPTEAEGGGAASYGTGGAAANVKETAYYDVLGVAPDADEKKIKRAYYVNARKWHPDRNDSPEAKDKFQAIGEAYQVLGDPKLRAAYDKEGEEGLSGDRTEISPDKLDPSLVFAFLFGSDSFDDIVGRLQLVTQTMAGGGDSVERKVGPAQMAELERRRVIRLAVKLRERIQTYVDGDAGGAAAVWAAEAKRLVEVRYGQEILNTVGSTYRLVATQCAGSWGEGMQAQMSENEMKMGAVQGAVAGAQNMQRGGESGDDQLPAYVEIMWNVTVIDITTTLREVVMKVLLDKSVGGDVRRKRAEAIKFLGSIFEGQKCIKNRDQRSARGLYQSAAQAAMEKTLETMREREGQMD